MVSGQINVCLKLLVLSNYYKTKYISHKEFSFSNHVGLFFCSKILQSMPISLSQVREPGVLKYCILLSVALPILFLSSPPQAQLHQFISKKPLIISFFLLPIQICYSIFPCETNPPLWLGRLISFKLYLLLKAFFMHEIFALLPTKIQILNSL